MIGEVWAVTVPALGVSVNFGFNDSVAAQLVKDCVTGRISGARLPSLVWSVTPDPPDVTLEVLDRGDELDLRVSGRIDTPRYRVDKAGFHWDFSKMLTSLALPQVIQSGAVPFHAACIDFPGAGLALLPGASGAGKSSVAFAAASYGGSVVASELVFVRLTEVLAANSLMTIDPPAASHFGLTMPPGLREIDGRLVLNLPQVQAGQMVTRLCFPRVSTGRVRIRHISSRRARMLLFENVMGQLGISTLLNHESTPIGMPPTKGELTAIMTSVMELSALQPRIVEGSPNEIADALSRATL